MRLNLLNLVAGPSKRPAQTCLAAIARSRNFTTTPLRANASVPPASSSPIAESSSGSSSAGSNAVEIGADGSFHLSEEELQALEQQFLSSQKPYFVERTDNGELPVYSKIRKGNQVKTIIRKVKGDVSAFQADLNDFLAATRSDPLGKLPKATVRHTNKHVEVKGRKVAEVKSWLQGQGY